MSIGLKLYHNEPASRTIHALEGLFSREVGDGRIVADLFVDLVSVSVGKGSGTRITNFSPANYVRRLKSAKYGTVVACSEGHDGYESIYLDADYGDSELDADHDKPWRHQLTFFVDQQLLPEFTEPLFLSAAMDLANVFNPVSGVIEKEELPYLTHLLHCVGTSGLSKEQNSIIGSTFLDEASFGGTKYRDSSYGVFLPKHYVDDRGGPRIVKKEYQAMDVTRLDAGGVYVQK